MNNFNDIISYFNGSTVEGYIWMSDSTFPIYYKDDVLNTDLIESLNPFPVELALYSKELNKSLMARYVDGQYIITSKDICEGEYSDEIYWPSFNKCIDKSGVIEKFNKKIKMRQYWSEVIDDNCDGMTVLQPDVLVFVGFVD